MYDTESSHTHMLEQTIEIGTKGLHVTWLLLFLTNFRKSLDAQSLFDSRISPDKSSDLQYSVMLYTGVRSKVKSKANQIVGLICMWTRSARVVSLCNSTPSSQVMLLQLSHNYNKSAVARFARNNILVAQYRNLNRLNHQTVCEWFNSGVHIKIPT